LPPLLNNVIGKNNQLLWSLPNDMKFFKNTTWAMPVLMGRKTFESLGKPLPGRLNIVITRQKDWKPEGATIVHSLEDAIKAALQLITKKHLSLVAEKFLKKR
jgi:dihydrofolate reductase